MIPWLSDDTPFPSVERALSSPNGLLAAGGELTVPRLLEAYRSGIFPWFNPGDPILWWSPNPRMVLIPGEFKTSRSLAKMLRNTPYEVRTDTAFEQVMRGCAAPRAKNRAGHPGTWIDEDMITAYCALHQLGYAHSVEVWMPKKSFQFQIEGETRRQRSNEMDSASLIPTFPQRGKEQSTPLPAGEGLGGGVFGTAMSERYPVIKLSSFGYPAITSDLASVVCSLSRMASGSIKSSLADSQVEWLEVTPGSQRSIADELELELVGGLYGVSIGRMFYGESMFSDVSNASKIALAHLARQLERWQFGPSTRLRTGMIDCQMNTPHLATLGAREIPRSEFIASLQELVHCAPIADWKFDSDLFT